MNAGLIHKLMGPSFSSPTAAGELIPVHGARRHYVSSALAEDGLEIMRTIEEQMRRYDDMHGPLARMLERPIIQFVDLVSARERQGVRVAVRVPIEIVVHPGRVEARLVGEG